MWPRKLLPFFYVKSHFYQSLLNENDYNHSEYLNSKWDRIVNDLAHQPYYWIVAG